ncbi:hypothetical protein [Agrobacterium sp. LAD9]|uniref:hypothetical protein n=1 Tax=Agrobacterium sp. LAD9 TaxID=2055153 RepID=UPI00128FEDE7|nr:hypothetical protein [Agrobacterium sp. LAD9]
MADRLQGVNIAPSANAVARPMVRAEQVVERSGIGDFLSGLGKLNPTLQQFANTLQAEENDPQGRQDEAARIQFQTMGKSAGDIASIDTRGMNERETRALGFRQGTAYANEVQLKIQQEIANAPPGSVNVDQLYDKYQQEANKQFAGNTTAMRGWAETMDPFLGNMKQGVFKDGVKEQLTQRASTVQAVFSSEWAKVSASSPGDPQAGLAAITKMAKENEQFLGMSLQEQGDVLKNLLTQASMSGDPTQVQALGEFDVSGQKLKNIMGPVFENLSIQAANRSEDNRQKRMQPLISDWQFTAEVGALDMVTMHQMDKEMKAGNITRAAYSQIISKNHNALEKQRAELYQQQKRLAGSNYIQQVEPDLIQQAADGTLPALQSEDTVLPQPDGTFVTVTSKDKVARGLAGAVDQRSRFKVEALGKDATPEQQAAAKADAEIEVYAANSLLPEAQKKSAQALLRRSNFDIEITDADRAGVGDLMRITRHADGLIDEVVQTGKDKAFVYTLTSLASIGPVDDAIRQARQARANYDTRTPLAGKVLDETVDKVTELLKVDQEGYVFDTKSTWGNDVSGMIKKQVRALQGIELSGDALAETVARVIKSNATKYNGFMVNTQGLPVNNPSQFNAMLDAVTATIKADPKYKDMEITYLRNGQDTSFVPMALYKGIPTPIPGLRYTFKQIQRTYNEAVKADPQRNFDQNIKKSNDKRTAREMRQMSP